MSPNSRTLLGYERGSLNRYIQLRGARCPKLGPSPCTPAPLESGQPLCPAGFCTQPARDTWAPWTEVRSSRTAAAPSLSVTCSRNQSYISNWVKSSLISGATCCVAFAASVIAFRYIPFFLRLNLSLKNSEKGDSFEIDKNDVVGDPNHETFASCQEGSPSSFWPRLMSRTRAGHQGKP